MSRLQPMKCVSSASNKILFWSFMELCLNSINNANYHATTIVESGIKTEFHKTPKKNLVTGTRNTLHRL
jgi:hypothetical protein